MDTKNPDSRPRRPGNWLAWGLCAVVVGLSLLEIGLSLAGQAGQADLQGRVKGAVMASQGLPFAVVAALIMSRQPRNIIGWLLLLPAFAFAVGLISNYFLSRYPQAPAAPSLPLLALIWFAGWGWLLLIFPILLIPLLFPAGRLLGRRWRWVAAAVMAEAAIFILLATFTEVLTPVTAENVTWSVSNPIGFLPEALVEALIGPWVLVLGALTLLCVAALFVRYRRAGAVERTQIRWLLYACGLFAGVYVSSNFLPLETATGERTLAGYVWDAGFWLAIVAIPAAIAIAILRYRLWEIDVIIRRTLIYSVLTGLLALAYFGSVLVLQPLLTRLTGQGTTLSTVLSTLVIAALFMPLRQRVQAVIDRRLYRRKYDAARILAEFAASMRDETDLDTLTTRLGRVVEQTVQPAHVGLWLKAGPDQRP